MPVTLPSCLASSARSTGTVSLPTSVFSGSLSSTVNAKLSSAGAASEFPAVFTSLVTDRSPVLAAAMRMMTVPENRSVISVSSRSVQVCASSGRSPWVTFSLDQPAFVARAVLSPFFSFTYSTDAPSL